jgi:hypothetical protein
MKKMEKTEKEKIRIGENLTKILQIRRNYIFEREIDTFL